MQDQLEKAKSDIALLRAALADLLEESDNEALRAMEGAIRTLPLPAEYKSKTIKAIHAMLATSPCN